MRDINADSDSVFRRDPMRRQQLVPQEVAGFHAVCQYEVRIELGNLLDPVVLTVVDDVLNRRVTFGILETVEDLDAVRLPRYNVRDVDVVGRAALLS